MIHLYHYISQIIKRFTKLKPLSFRNSPDYINKMSQYTEKKSLLFQSERDPDTLIVQEEELQSQEINITNQHISLQPSEKREKNNGMKGRQTQKKIKKTMIKEQKLLSPKRKWTGTQKQQNQYSTVLKQWLHQYQEENINQIASKCQSIQTKLVTQLAQGNLSGQRTKFKLFTQIVQTKTDVQRRNKQRRFVRSQQSRYNNYQQPQMPTKLVKIHQRARSEVYDEDSLNRKAKQFSQKHQIEQQRLLGRCFLRKQAAQKKRQFELKREMKKQEILKQIKMLDSNKGKTKEPLFAQSRVLNLINTESQQEKTIESASRSLRPRHLTEGQKEIRSYLEVLSPILSKRKSENTQIGRKQVSSLNNIRVPSNFSSRDRDADSQSCKKQNIQANINQTRLFDRKIVLKQLNSQDSQNDESQKQEESYFPRLLPKTKPINISPKNTKNE